MSASIHTAGIGQNFHALYRRLSRPLANVLLDDCIYELPAAWKFLTALRQELPILAVVDGFSGAPLAFARHHCRVDILGFNQEEAEFFRELTQYKKLSNCRICRGIDELQGLYGLILWLPTRHTALARDEQERLMQAMAQLHQQGELWLALCYKPGWTSPLHRLKRAVRHLKARDREPYAPIRLLPFAAPIPNQSLLDEIRTRFFSPTNGRAAFKHIDHIGIIPDWSAPTLIAPLHAEAASAETSHAFKALEPKKLSEAHHALARFRSEAILPFISRLFAALEKREPGSHIQPNHFRVLAGGKVQIDARWKKRYGEQAFFIKLPLVHFAETRLQKQFEMLSQLQRPELWHRFEPLPKPAPAQPQKVFPGVLGRGEFEGQAYFLESRVKGVPLSRLQVPREAFHKVCDTLFLFWHQVQMCSGAPVQIDRGKFTQFFQQPLSRLAEWAQPPQPYREILRKLEDFFASHFGEQRVFLGLTHGDFSTKNILANPKTFELSGIIDWDMATHQSIPLLDVLHFFVRVDPSSFREAPPKIAMRLIKPNAQALHWPLLQGAMTKFGYEEKTLPAAVAYYWVQRLLVYLDSPKNLDTQFMQRHFYEMLDFFNETILKR
ncbi:MAG: phosphotransferase family protein [bacterium]